MHFKPQDGIYVYFRYDDSDCVMVAINGNDTDKTLDTARFAEMLQGYTKGMNVETDETYNQLSTLVLKKKSTLILQLKN